MHINVWYEGLDVKVGEQFEKDNVVIMLILPNGDEERINCKNAQFLNTVVEKEGINWYTVICYINHTIYQRKFSVNGYIPVEHPDLDFSVYYIDKHNQKIDYTGKFKDKFTFDGVFIITWEKFLEEVNSLNKYGLYILTAPKLTGLSNQYDQEWEVICKDKYTLKANVSKTYREEEDLSWQEQQKQQ